MESNPFSIFETPADHVNWDKYDQQVDLIEQLSDADKRRAKKEIRYLRPLLGENFLQRAAADGNPIFFWFFANAAPTARLSLIRLAEELKAFEGALNFKGLVVRLKDGERAAEALTVLNAAFRFWSFKSINAATGASRHFFLIDF